MPRSMHGKPKPTEVAAETKRHYIPHIKENCSEQWTLNSYLYPVPFDHPLATRDANIPHTSFHVYSADPVDFALNWAAQTDTRVGFICAANDKRAGGDWDTGSAGYEERLCRRSTLSANLTTPGPNSIVDEHYPIPNGAGLFSNSVVVFRGPHDRYEKIAQEEWRSLPVISMPPVRWPKLNQNGTKYSFTYERQMIFNQLRGALWICAYNSISYVVIGDFGLGNNSRNPPQELAEIWREIFLYDPDLRGRIVSAAFVFEDENQCTTKLILDDLAKKAKSGGKGTGTGSGNKKLKSRGSAAASSSSSAAAASSSSESYPTDFAIYQHIFSDAEIQRFQGQSDPRLGVQNLVT